MTSYHAFDDLLVKAAKGLEFYAKLDTNVSKLLNKVKGVTAVQQEERDAILAKAANPIEPIPQFTPYVPQIIQNFPNPADLEQVQAVVRNTPSPVVSSGPSSTPGKLTLKDYMNAMKESNATAKDVYAAMNKKDPEQDEPEQPSAPPPSLPPMRQVSESPRTTPQPPSISMPIGYPGMPVQGQVPNPYQSYQAYPGSMPHMMRMPMPGFQPTTSLSQPIVPSQAHPGNLNNAPTNGHAHNKSNVVQASQPPPQSPKRSTPTTTHSANPLPQSQRNQSVQPLPSLKPEDPVQQQPRQPSQPMQPGQPG